MPRLAIVSDIHYNQTDDYELHNTNSADILILAGDIINLNVPGARGLHEFWLSSTAENFETVIYVPGNHEFYGNSYTATRDRLRETCEKYGIIYLDPGVYEYFEDLKFVGATLWTDFNAMDPAAVDAYFSNIADPHMICNFDAVKQKAINSLERQFLLENVDENTVVVTHHTPSMASCHEKWGNDAINYSFHNTELEDSIIDLKPKLWIHGHTHDVCDYNIGDTRVVCNPRGYESERIPGYSPLYIDV